MKTLFKLMIASNYITKVMMVVCLGFLLMSSTCSDAEQVETCDCEIGYYLYTPHVGGGGGNYVLQFTQPIDFDCVNDAYGEYYPVSNINYNYAKVECNN